MAEPRDRPPRDPSADAARPSAFRLAGAVLVGVALLSRRAAWREPRPHPIARSAPSASVEPGNGGGVFGIAARDYERQDMNLAGAGFVLLATFALLVIVPLVIWAVYPRTVLDVSRRLAIHPPAPELQIDPAADLRRYRKAVDARLDSYGWVDKAKGIVHIPIERAMQSLAQDGIPGFPKATP